MCETAQNLALDSIVKVGGIPGRKDFVLWQFGVKRLRRDNAECCLVPVTSLPPDGSKAIMEVNHSVVQQHH